MLTLKPGEIEVFRAGVYPQGVYTEADLDDIVATYDPVNEHRAFLGLDAGYTHKRSGPGRAYGYFDTLRRDGKSLIGALNERAPKPVLEAFATGEVPAWSAEIYENYNGTGKRYLKAVKMLGAEAPAIKGLKSALADFAEDVAETEHGEVRRFSMVAVGAAPYAATSLKDAVAEREMREGLSDLIFAFQCQTDRVMNADDLTPAQKQAEITRLSSELAALSKAGLTEYSEQEGDTVGNETQKGTGGEAQPKGAQEPTPAAEKAEAKGVTPDPQTEARFAEVAAENARLKAENEANAARILKIEREGLRNVIHTFAEGAVRENKINKGDLDAGFEAFMEAIDGVTFEPKPGEKQTARAFMEAFVSRRVTAVPRGVMGEGTPGAGQRTGTEDVPHDADPESASFAERCDAYSKEHKVSYHEARVALIKQEGNPYRSGNRAR